MAGLRPSGLQSEILTQRKGKEGWRREGQGKGSGGEYLSLVVHASTKRQVVSRASSPMPSQYCSSCPRVSRASSFTVSR